MAESELSVYIELNLGPKVLLDHSLVRGVTRCKDLLRGSLITGILVGDSQAGLLNSDPSQGRGGNTEKCQDTRETHCAWDEEMPVWPICISGDGFYTAGMCFSTDIPDARRT